MSFFLNSIDISPLALQAYGLSQPQYTIGGTLTGVAGDYWDVLWPHSTNSVSLGFLILSRSPQELQPSKVGTLHAQACLPCECCMCSTNVNVIGEDVLKGSVMDQCVKFK